MTSAKASEESVVGLALGTLLPTVLGVLFGSVYAWAGSVDTLLPAPLAGGVIGLCAVLVPAFGLSWHGSAVRASATRAATAPLWGVIPGALIGISLGPSLGGVAGSLLGNLQLGITIGMFGLVSGPLAWQLAYWGQEVWSDSLRALRHPSGTSEHGGH
jgi:hypothetical protein